LLVSQKIDKALAICKLFLGEHGVKVRAAVAPQSAFFTAPARRMKDLTQSFQLNYFLFVFLVISYALPWPHFTSLH
jgi:exoribonuclease R